MADAPQEAPRDDEEFFVGYFPTPPKLRRFLALVAVLALLGTGGVAYAVARSQRAPAPGVERAPRVTLVGLYLARPYGMLRYVDPESGALRHAVVVEGWKSGPRASAAALDGTLVRASGQLLQRDRRAVLALAGGPAGLAPLEDAAAADPTVRAPSETEVAALRALAPVPLGRVRLVGEIVDSKCFAGSMRPGDGRAHRPCATYCLRGRIPPVLVTYHPTHGRRQFLLADREGGPYFEAALPLVGVPVEVEGELERHGDLALLRVDAARPL